jgi:signal transduction histidine kinase
MDEHLQKLAQLGRMSASLAHELKNPAAAAWRAASGLLDAYEKMKRHALDYDCRFDDREREAMLPILAVALRPGDGQGPALARDAQTRQLEAWLEQHGVDDPWELAAELVERGAPVEALLEMERVLRPETVLPALTWVKKMLHLQSLVEEVRQSALRVSEVARAMKEYSRADPEEAGPVDVERSLETVLALFGPQLRGAVEVVRDYVPVPPVRGWTGRLQQVWTNLVDNALQAMPSGGRLTIETGFDGKVARVRIADTGPGIPDELRARVFEPFVTTRADGTGLGLAICRRIIEEEHHGRIAVESAPGQGTVFTVTLPLYPQRQGGNPMTCVHLKEVADPPARTPDGCEECLKIGGRWVHLRLCRTCGHVGCCDSSPNRHATKHYHATQHPVMRSFEPGESWSWCYVDNAMV